MQGLCEAETGRGGGDPFEEEASPQLGVRPEGPVGAEGQHVTDQLSHLYHDPRNTTGVLRGCFEDSAKWWSLCPGKKSTTRRPLRALSCFGGLGEAVCTRPNTSNNPCATATLAKKQKTQLESYRLFT
mmetsp:Transcript_20055/g.34501  ORF Transcript_20055/g.34501 Transcript_20055/m.34501 type:complete len:128 (+) Transcript_20055:505-888(+)